MTTRDIEAHLQEIYGVDVSPGPISNVTEAVMEEVKIWQGRSLDEVYPMLDATIFGSSSLLGFLRTFGAVGTSKNRWVNLLIL
jgi:hypothetical protein